MGYDCVYSLGLGLLTPARTVKEVDRLKKIIKFNSDAFAIYHCKDVDVLKKLAMELKSIMPDKEIVTGPFKRETNLKKAIHISEPLNDVTADVPIDIYEKLLSNLEKWNGVILSIGARFGGFEGSKSEITGNFWISVRQGKVSLSIAKHNREYQPEELTEIKSRTGLTLKLETVDGS